MDHRLTFRFISKCSLLLKLVAPNVKENAWLLGDLSQAFKNWGFVKVRGDPCPAGWGLPPQRGLGTCKERQQESANLFWDLNEPGETICGGSFRLEKG